MKVKQISVFLENKSGRLAELTQVIGNSKINMRALSIADTSNFGILRLIVDKPEAALLALKEAGFTVSMTDVIAVEVTDSPGSLGNILKLLENSGINVEYLYAFITRTSNDALVVLRVEQVDQAIKLLVDNGVTVVTEQKVYNL